MSRIESDSMGNINVPADRLYGAQTARSLINFAIGSETMPPAFIQAYALIKKVAAASNHALGKLSEELKSNITAAADEIISGQWLEHFPLSIWQTGSGTQTNMNVNEVISNRANQLVGSALGSKSPVHPNDHVNLSQSTNDTFPTAMHVASAIAIHKNLLPALSTLIEHLQDKQSAFADIIKIGRTHLQDAVPLTLGQEFSGYVAQCQHAKQQIESTLPHLYRLAMGGTAVGTGLNAHPDFPAMVAEKLASETGIPFVTAENKFAALAAHDEMVMVSGALRTLAVSLLKIANDIRWLGSGPRCGLGELILPANEPGSSIMPGKINPTQCEAMIMVCTQVMGNDQTISIAGAHGYLDVHVMKPVIIYNMMQSIELLSDTMLAFGEHCLAGLEANREQIDKHLHRSLILVTALNPIIGYDKAAKIAKLAYSDGMTLKEACLQLGFMTADEFDKAMDIRDMVS